jgi:hypothetical protein
MSAGEAADPTAEPVLAAPTAAVLRAELVDLVTRDLLGPAGGPEEEVAETRVRDRYLVGMLAPRRQRVAPEQQDGLAAQGTPSDEDGSDDGASCVSGSMFPSSIGLSFCVPAGTASVRVTARWGRYARTDRAALADGQASGRVWKRTPVDGSATMALAPGDLGPWAVTPDQPDVVVRGIARRREKDLIVTLFLVNGQTEPEQRRDEAWLFQVELVVESPDGKAVFFRRPVAAIADGGEDPEDRRMAMLYRRFSEFAVGHGVAASWDVGPDDPRRAVRIRTRVMPAYEVPQHEAPTADDNPDLAGLVLDMKALAEAEPAELPGMLHTLPDAYARWIETQRRATSSGDLAEYRDAAGEALDACERALARIRDGLALLEADPRAREAFRFANRAMWQQRVRTAIGEARRRGVPLGEDEADVPPERSWRPFQLGFILLNLPGMTRLDHPDRTDPTAAVADLLWFPTGGGKTEAYLGLAAYVMALRRLQGEIEGRCGESGVAVLMRYTLRLLTIQQFQRATALLCACEVIRRDALESGDERWGHEPFRIGLWVGQRTTPNTTKDSAEALKRERVPGKPTGGGVGTPAQLTNCPWCGAPIEPGRDIVVDGFERGRGRTLVFCGDATGRCPFTARNSPGEGIPAVVVDEEIYRRLPALLVATVDKFAQMPWNGRTQMLFGQVNGRCPRHGFRSPELDDSDSHPAAGRLPAVKSSPQGPLRPPDLIIQDELHLISGPLGSLTGLYEAAVDRLCTWTVGGRSVHPKVIASTATVRRADEQVNSLFLRRVDVFPPPGLDADGNFFSVRRPTDRLPGRLYLGVCAPGRRLKAALIRTYIVLLAASQRLYEKYGPAADPWLTLVGYFNTVRELAGMRRLVDDDVRSRLRDADRRGLAKRQLAAVDELTSRRSSTDIPRLLARMERTFEPPAKTKKGEKKPAAPLDVLLATSMISVGVDVRRLGLMVVGGQPKTTSEYIQATSRIGRRFPGLVCTVYNWARPRDLSHYETFEHYHSTFYEHVEALSVTPFAPRALDRGLSALLVALARLAGTALNANEAAQTLRRNDPLVRQAIDAIARRAERVLQSKAAGDEVRAQLESRVDEWLSRAASLTGGAKLGYQMRRDGTTIGLLSAAEGGSWSTFTCLNSLRDVEPSVNLVLDDRGMDGRPGGAP